MTRAIWILLKAELAAAQATLPSGNDFHDCHGWSGAEIVNFDPMAAPVPASQICAAIESPDCQVRSMLVGP